MAGDGSGVAVRRYVRPALTICALMLVVGLLLDADAGAWAFLAVYAALASAVVGQLRRGAPVGVSLSADHWETLVGPVPDHRPNAA